MYMFLGHVLRELNVQRCLEDNVEEDNVVTGRSVEGLNDLRPKR